MAVITISRQYGSGGDEIAARVCEMLDYAYFDKRLMSQIASEAGLSETEMADFSEHNYKTQTFLDRLLGRRRVTVDQVRTWKEDAKGVRVAETRELGEEQAISLVRGTVQAAYRRGNVVIVGRGGQALLGDKPGVLHVRIEAPRDTRVYRIQVQRLVDRPTAEGLISERDTASAAYLKRFYGIDVSESRHYHLVINAEKWDLEAAARLIVSAVSNLPPAEQPT